MKLFLAKKFDEEGSGHKRLPYCKQNAPASWRGHLFFIEAKS